VSRRQLIRMFTKATGQSPHEVAARLRFERARDAIMHNPDVSLTALAQDCGYSDQPHFNHDFRQYMGITPGEYAEMFRQVRPQMQDPQRVSFL
jgi:AraC family transcriptional regulator